jgi:hypothetical protein
MGGILDSNLQILKRNFHYFETEKVTPDSISEMVKTIGIDMSPSEIVIKTDRKHAKKYYVFNKDQKPLFFLKEVWEHGVISEVAGLHMAKYILDPELVPDNYIFGFLSSKKPFLLTTIVPGEPIKKYGWEQYSFQLGRQFRLHQIINLYDCDLRHFFASEKQVRRIDFGLCFSNLNGRYRGFEEYMPKGLPYMVKFWRGFQAESEKIDIMLLNTREELRRLLSEIEKLREDDVVRFTGSKFVPELKDYWKREKIKVFDTHLYETEPEDDVNV